MTPKTLIFLKKKIGDKCSHIGRTAGSLTILSNMCMVHEREERGIKRIVKKKCMMLALAKLCGFLQIVVSFWGGAKIERTSFLKSDLVQWVLVQECNPNIYICICI